MNFMGMIKWVVYSLVIIGALNWGLIGAFNFDLVSFFFGEMTFYSAGGFVRVNSKEMDEKIGSWIDLKKYRQYMV